MPRHLHLLAVATHHKRLADTSTPESNAHATQRHSRQQWVWQWRMGGFDKWCGRVDTGLMSHRHTPSPRLRIPKDRIQFLLMPRPQHPVKRTGP
eukprot:7050844-Pyramimonas_sp.AAC.1